MGCGSSKEKVCRNCQVPYSPVRRSFSMRQKPKKSVDSSHQLVSLTSSTLGSLNLDPLIQTHNLERTDLSEVPINQNQGFAEDKPCAEKGEIIGTRNVKEEFDMTMIEAKTWSDMIDKRIPKIASMTPIRTPPGEPEMINVWELMEDLEDVSPLRQVHHFRSFSFNMSSHASLASMDDQATPRLKEDGDALPKTPANPEDLPDSDSNTNSNDTSLVSEFDPDVIASFRRALDELPPVNPFNLKPLESEKQSDKECALEGTDGDKDEQPTDKMTPRGKERLIVYFTSLRGVRKTYEDCCQVRVVLKGLGVKVDERDVSMHSEFKDELRELLGEPFCSLPRVFLGKKHIGGAEEIRQLNEEGRLEKMMIERCEFSDQGSGSACDACGGIRFVPCATCSGSCKIFCEGEQGSELECGFQRCPDCNENGLTRCPICCCD